ncbi:MAG TPA: cytochrome c oxidase subunit 3 [Candidatus Angelobacter sp.]|nr:cytochrome c oxidase subunit 3 [Candidatus Angelobacter sp.]
MATTVTRPPKTSGDDRPQRPHSGNGGWRNLSPAGGSSLALGDSSPASRTGIWVGIAAITMTFAAFTSAMVIRQSSPDWQHFALPPILYFNTVLLFASSVTLELARRRFSSAVGATRSVTLAWLYATSVLGLLFVAGQYVAWTQLKAEGLYLATNPSSSFFYLFTAAHVLHVLGGLAALGLVIWRLNQRVPTLRGSTLATVSYYWHFMDVLWVYLLLLLWMRL